MMARLLTLQHIYIHTYIHTYIHIYICCKVKKWSNFCALFKVKKWSNVFVVFVLFVFKNLVLPAERRGVLKNKPTKNNKKNTIFKVKKWSNYVAQHNWTTF